MNNPMLGPILISSDSEDDLPPTTAAATVTITISDSSPPNKRFRACDNVLLGRPRLSRPNFKKRHKKPSSISGPIIVISDDESDTPPRDECVASPESTKENKAVEIVDLDDIEFKPNMESSPILSERHMLSPKNYSIIASPTNKYSPIKRSEALKCLKPNSINTKSRNIKCMKQQQNFKHVNQARHHPWSQQLIRPIDNFPRIPLPSDVVVRRGHIPHKQLPSAGLPNHLTKKIYRSSRINCDGRKQDVHEFSNIHNNIIDAYIEEGIDVEGVTFIRHFTTTSRSPEEHCLKYLLNTLLATDSSRELTCTTYSTLKHVQNHHPLSRRDFPDDWDQIMNILNDCNISNMNRLLYLDLLTDVFESDLHQHKLDNTVGRSFISVVLNPERKMLNLSKVINLLMNVVQRTSDSIEASVQKRVIFLLQKIFALCIDVCKSRVEAAMRIAEDLIYPFRNELNFEQRREILETIQSDVLRLKLIELWLENCCEIKDSNVNIPAVSEPISVDKIVNRYFRCKPEDGNSGACEELSMVLYLLLKSYLAHTAGKINPSSTVESVAACYCSLQLSLEDKKWLIVMGDTVSQLRYHLTSFAALTPKTQIYLNYIEVLQDLVDV